jgi:hypothetical protein
MQSESGALMNYIAGFSGMFAPQNALLQLLKYENGYDYDYSSVS